MSRTISSSDSTVHTMPTSTQPFEVLLELTNDTTSSATVQLTRREGGHTGGPIILLQEGESVSLVLNAGATYVYRLRHLSMGIVARISVKAWHDTQCSAAGVFAGQYNRDCGAKAGQQMVEDVASITYLGNT